MDIQEQLKYELSRRNTNLIANYIGKDSDKFKLLMDLLLYGDPPVPQRAAWVITSLTEQCPEILEPYLEIIVSELERFSHTGIHRCLLRSFSEMRIPEALQGVLYDVCARWLISKDTPIAVKVHCMQIMFNISEAEPDLKHELRLILEELTHHESPGLKSRSRHLWNRLNQ